MFKLKKAFPCSLAGMLLALSANAQTLFTYGSKPVSQQEFIRAFEKNPTPGDKIQAMKEYLPLFINYKLKVQDAIDKKMDTLQTQKEELENFRNQLVENFISTKSNADALVKEAFERSQSDILLGHLFVGFNPADSSGIKTAFEKSQKALAALETGNDFAAVVKQYSNDEANRQSGGRAGWISVFSVPYPFETVIYELKQGAHSQVIKSSSGFHIFKKLDQRPAIGTVKVAQVMLVNPEPGNQAIEDKNKRLADSLYTLLKNGASFDSIAYDFSNDRTSYDKGGQLPEFGVGSYAGEFEDVAFSLAKKGDISKPFKTAYGIHLLKLLDKKPVPASIEEAEQNNILSQKVAATGRTLAAKNAYLKSLLPALKSKTFPVKENDLFVFTDSSFNGLNTRALAVNEKTPLYTLGNTTVTADDWLQFVKTAKFSPGGENKSYNELMPEFRLASIENYVHKNVQEFDTAFKEHFREFKDANLLFEAMERNVWNKASADTTGLQTWYNKHKEKYQWNESAIAAMITCSDSSVFTGVYDKLVSNPLAWHELSESNIEGFYADSGRYELNQLPGATTNDIKAGTVTNPVKNELDGSLSFACIFKLLPAKEQRNFEDAKGFVINDYQQELEQKWVALLKKKYPVSINQAAWNKLISQYK